MRPLAAVALAVATSAVGQTPRPDPSLLDRAAREVETSKDPLGVARAAARRLPETERGFLALGRYGDRASFIGPRLRASIANDLRAVAAAAAFAPTEGAAAEVAAIQRDPAYSRGPSDASRSWLGRLIEVFLRWLRRFLRDDPAPGTIPSLSLPGWLTPLMWILIAAGLAVAAIPLVRIALARAARARRRKGGLLEEEPERTRDEYLALADELAARGEFREALRMLYLATLKRFDEARVARFDRGETNWEHLRRINASPRLPSGLDFRPATAAFDLHWYGGRPADAEVYGRFQAWYGDVERRLREAPAPETSR